MLQVILCDSENVSCCYVWKPTYVKSIHINKQTSNIIHKYLYMHVCVYVSCVCTSVTLLHDVYMYVCM